MFVWMIGSMLVMYFVLYVFFIVFYIGVVFYLVCKVGGVIDLMDVDIFGKYIF